MHVKIAEEDALADRGPQATGAAIDLAARRLLRGVLLRERRVRKAPAFDLTRRLVASAADQQRETEQGYAAAQHGRRIRRGPRRREPPRASEARSEPQASGVHSTRQARRPPAAELPAQADEQGVHVGVQLLRAGRARDLAERDRAAERPG